MLMIVNGNDIINDVMIGTREVHNDLKFYHWYLLNVFFNIVECPIKDSSETPRTSQHEIITT